MSENQAQNASTAIKPRRASRVDTWDQDADVIVVGFGGAGACAAIEAADAGARVALFELSSASGGSTAMSGAEIYMGGGGGTPIQRACGFTDSTEDMANYLMLAGGPQADEAKVRAYTEGSLEHFQWLTSLGITYKESFHQQRAIVAMNDDCLLYTGNEKAWPFNQAAEPCPRGHNIQIEGDNGGPVLMKALTERVNQHKLIEVHYDARVLNLIADDGNHVQGIVVRIDRQERNVRARKAVILCAGGFVMNEAMVKKYAPSLSRATMPIGNPGDTGAGILMGLGVGGVGINMGEGMVTLLFYPPQSHTYGIFVNAQAQRFINEDRYHGRVGHYIMQQLGNRIYLILHQSDYERSLYMNADIAATGESVAELASELGLDTDALQRTIDVYNGYCDKGEDGKLHKAKEWLKKLEMPLVALDCTPGRGAFFPYFTLGGLDTLPSGEVVNAHRDPIPGLYAAGRTACGIARSAAGYSSGMSVGDATYFGRLAGKSAAAQAARA